MKSYYTDKKLWLKDTNLTGSFSWAAPSNIAFVKYWGKEGLQIPMNPSLSMTLKNSVTKTTLEYAPKEVPSENIDFALFFEGDRSPKFEKKIAKFFSNIKEYFPFLTQLKFTLKTENTFPHSAGIASSASSMASIALCLCSFEKEHFGTLKDEGEFNKKASFMARLGSGSACRSISGEYVCWGENDQVSESSDLYGVPVELGLDLADTILLVDSSEKSVSSTVGHGLMDGHPYRKARRDNAHTHLKEMLSSLQKNDFTTFGKILEKEALELHALMMCSPESFILMKPQTLSVIEKLRVFRKNSGLPVYFTLDAGPNLHLIYPRKHRDAVTKWLDEDVKELLENGRYIHDEKGTGAYAF